MILVKRTIRSLLTNDSTYLTLLGNPSEEPYKTFYLYPTQTPDFPYVLFALNVGFLDDEVDSQIISRRYNLVFNVYAQDSSFEDITDRIIYLLHQVGNEHGFRIIYRSGLEEIYDSELNAWIKSISFDLFDRKGVNNLSLDLIHGDLQGLANDDHTQYHNDSRANIWLATKSIADLGTKDHDLLDGLLDDDHTQYILADGTRILTGNWAIGDYSITGINNLEFTDINGQIAGIENQNLLDKTAPETITGIYTFNDKIIAGTHGGIDIGDSSNSFRTVYLKNDGGNVIVCEGVQSGGGPTNYIFNCGGGQFGGEQNQGGTFTFKMNDIASSLGTCVNQIIFDPGRPDVFAAGTNNVVIFQADNGIATYGFVSSFGSWNDVEYGLELRRTSGTETFSKTLIFDNQIPVSDFRRSIDFRINSVNKLTIENSGEVVVTDRITAPRADITAIQSGSGFGNAGVQAIQATAYLNFFNLNWFDYLTLFAQSTNLPACLGIFPNGTGTASYVNVYNSSNTGATAWLQMGVRAGIAELLVRDFSQTTNITELNIGSGGNDFPTFDVTCSTLTDINLVFAGVTKYNFTPTAFTLSDANNIIVGTTTGTKIGTATNQKIGFYGKTPVTQRLKANYNNWAALSDVINALVDLGLLDQA